MSTEIIVDYEASEKLQALITKRICNNSLAKNLELNVMPEKSKVRMVSTNESIPVFDCNICQSLCKNCKSVCVTCKSPCSKCNQKDFKNVSSDTDDFDKYLESLSKKIKVQVKVKAVGIDTCDLEGHFDYYKLEKNFIRIQKDVATDCIGLNLRKPAVKKIVKNSIATDTSDLIACLANIEHEEESDYEFFWGNKEELKSYSKKPTQKLVVSAEKSCEDDISENSLVIDEDSSLHPSLKSGEDNKENYNIVNSNTFNDLSDAEESDIDLATSSKVFKSKTLAKKHNIILKKVENENGVIFKCSICGKTFLKKYLGIMHLGNHVESNSFKCLSCCEKFNSLDELFSHVKESHSDVDSDEQCLKEKDDFSSDLPKSKTKTFKCTLCSESFFYSYKSLYSHKKEKHGIEKRKKNEETKVEKKQRIKREFICLLCGKQFKSSKSLKDHSPVHTGEKNYHCDICNKSYTTSANLKIHIRTHTGTRDFVCSVCGKAFHKKDSLKVHFRKHSGERPYQCDLCPMNFDRNYILKNHRYTHFSEKTFICPVCGKAFTTHGGLNNHEKSHKKDPLNKKPRKPAVKPTLDTENAVICDVCGKIYSTKNNLRIHKFVHLGVKPFECNICHQTYAKKDSMLIHMRKHTDERPFACQTCGMTFYRNHTLKTHMLRHTGERPHKCHMCGKSFTQSSSLTYHIRNHDKKAEKVKALGDDSAKHKKKRLNQGNHKSVSKKIRKTIKPEISEDNDFVEKKSESSEEISKEMILNLPEKNEEILKNTHFTLPVSEKEVLMPDKNQGIDFSKIPSKEVDFFHYEKDVYSSNQYNLGKYNYYIAKNHIFFPKETSKSKAEPKEVHTDEKEEEEVENLIISKNSYITKEGNLITVNRESCLKEGKEEFVTIVDQRLGLKSQTTIPITGEILNAAFITDESGDVIPLSSMGLQNLNPENIMMSPFLSAEGVDRKNHN